MAYRLKIDDAPQKSVRRIGRQQIDSAIRHLESKGDRATAIHEARRCFKRIRSLLRLVRPGLSPEAYQRENAEARDVGKLLSSARDLHVMLDTLEIIEARHAEDTIAGLAPLKAHLIERRAKTLDTLNGKTAKQALTRLRSARERWSDLRLEPNAFQVIADGFETSYRNALRAMHHARADGGDEALHEWRKGVQRHRDHAQLLRAAWPEYFEARYQSAKTLAKWLGDDHDLAVLKAYPGHADGLALKRGEARAVAAICAARQQEIRRAAWALGERLFADRPAALSRRLTTYWASASAIRAEEDQAERAAGTQDAADPEDRSATAEEA